MGYVIGVDIGGTFTDCAVLDESGKVVTAKALSTPDDYVNGVTDAVRNAGDKLGLGGADALLDKADLFLHACTVGDNTLLADTSQRVGLITTAGFRDTLSMMRGLGGDERTELVAPGLVEELDERIDSRGSVVIKLDEANARSALNGIVENGATAIAVSLLWSVLNDSHEQLVAQIAGEMYPEIPVLVSSSIAPYMGEYERTASAVIAAYIAPTLRGYLSRLSERLQGLGLRSHPLIMQAHGGMIGIEDAIDNPIGSIESGPAAGVIGCAAIGERMGEGNVIVTDMGGTTFKVGIVTQGNIATIRRPIFHHHTLLAEKVRVESIGAGGGSMAWVDEEFGRLKVGPQGAGSKPGPVCYGFGGVQPTVADADLLLGYLNPESVLGGDVPLERGLAELAMSERVGDRLNLSTDDAAQGVSRIVNAHMADLIRRSTVAQGLDPRDFTVFAVGGAAPMHAARYCRDLGVKRFIVPRVASVGGAFGLLMSDISLAFTQAVRFELPVAPDVLDDVFDDLSRRATEQLRGYGLEFGEVTQERSVDVRFRYQLNELGVPLPRTSGRLDAEHISNIASTFDQIYEQTFGPGSTYEGAKREIVSVRLKLRAELNRPDFTGSGLDQPAAAETNASEHGLRSRRRAWFDGTGWEEETPVLLIDAVAADSQVHGPAILEDDVTTIVVDPGYVAYKDALGNIVVEDRMDGCE